MTMKAYPFKMYFSACGLIWTAAIVAVVFGVVPQIRSAVDSHTASKAA